MDILPSVICSVVFFIFFFFWSTEGIFFLFYWFMKKLRESTKFKKNDPKFSNSEIFFEEGHHQDNVSVSNHPCESFFVEYIFDYFYIKQKKAQGRKMDFSFFTFFLVWNHSSRELLHFFDYYSVLSLITPKDNTE